MKKENQTFLSFNLKIKLENLLLMQDVLMFNLLILMETCLHLEILMLKLLLIKMELFKCNIYQNRYDGTTLLPWNPRGFASFGLPIHLLFSISCQQPEAMCCTERVLLPSLSNQVSFWFLVLTCGERELMGTCLQLLWLMEFLWKLVQSLFIL